VAHNPQAAGVLADNLGNMGFYPETWAVFGMLADKDVAAVVMLMAGRVDHWLLADLPGPRGLSAAALADRVRAVKEGADVRCFASPSEAYAAAQKLLAEDDRIVVFGSFLTVADVLGAMAAARRG
jgi:dihydrofolate synthase/folylpolyglutamate synthase